MRPAGAGGGCGILTAMLYFLQPIARLQGRLTNGLTPGRRRGPPGFRLPVPRRGRPLE